MRSEARAKKVKVTARNALRAVRGTSSPISRGSSHANMAIKCRHQMEQKPKVKLPSNVQTRTPERYRDVRA
jgi:hypothetical protein